MQNENNKSNLVIILLVVIVALVGFMTYDVADKMSYDSQALATRDAKVVGADSYVKYRFRRIFTGHEANLAAKHDTKTLPTMTTTRPQSHVASGAGVAASAQSFATLPTTVPMASASGLRTSSSATLQSYGGGAAMSGNGMTIGRKTAPSVGMQNGAIAYSYAQPVKTIRRITSNQTEMPSRTMHRVAPSYGGVGAETYIDTEEGKIWQWNDEDEEWGEITGPGHFVGETKEVGGTYYRWNGTSWEINTTSEVDNPIGSTPWLLMLLMAVAYAGWKMREGKDGAVLDGDTIA